VTYVVRKQFFRSSDYFNEICAMSIEELYRIYEQNPSVQTDTRKLKNGDLFFALKGENFDGNAFAKKAIEKGAAYAVIDDEKYALKHKTILVKDVLRSLQELAKYHRQQFNIPFLAITGSNGKTTTKELIHAVLSTTFRTYTTQGNLNNHIGIPLTILGIRKDAQFAVIEMGANHIGEIAGYCEYAMPDFGIITNCGKAHLEGFGSEEGVRKGKGELFEYLRANTGTVFVMWDYKYLRDMSRGLSGVIKYGTSNAHVMGKIMRSEPYLFIDVFQGIDDGLIATQLVGEYNFPNVLAAVTVGKYFNVPDNKVKTAIESYSPSNSRSQLVEKGSNKIILDAYNANPSSMKVAIENFAHLPAPNKVLLLGAMAELGEQSKKEHQEIVELLKKYQWKDVVLVGGDFQEIDHPFKRFDNADSAGRWLQEQRLENAYLLVKGSRSMRMENVLSE
jgi:UDP-N-acetylmuramoyl-tripeptide--D-alanyl-D-alanine ligase